MKFRKEIETAEIYYERNLLVVLSLCLLALITTGTCLYLFAYKDFENHGLALMLIPPALILSFQALIFILTPYIQFFKDRMEVNKHMFDNRTWYYNDIKKVTEVGNKKIKIIYNDDEEEMINLAGIKGAHYKKTVETLHRFIFENLEKRD